MVQRQYGQCMVRMVKISVFPNENEINLVWNFPDLALPEPVVAMYDKVSKCMVSLCIVSVWSVYGQWSLMTGLISVTRVRPTL